MPGDRGFDSEEIAGRRRLVLTHNNPWFVTSSLTLLRRSSFLSLKLQSNSASGNTIEDGQLGVDGERNRR